MAAFTSAVNSPTSAFSEASPAGLLSTVSASNASSEPPGCTIDGEPLRLPLAVFYSLFFVLGLAGNLFALWVFLFLHSSRNSVRVLLINCAVADLVLLASLPFRAVYHVNGDRWLLGPVACRFVGNIFYMNMYMSIVLLGLISLDRYLRLSGRGRSRRSTRLRPLWSWAVCGALWALFLAMSLTMVSTPEDKSFDGTCFQYKKRIASRWKAYINLTVVLMFWLVFVLLVVSYAKIASRLLQVFKNQPDFPNASKYKQTAKKSFFVLFLFTVCFVPYHTFRPFYILTQMDYFKSCAAQQLADRTNEVTLLFSVFNSCLDPVMYFLLSGSVRRTALRVVGRRLAGRLPAFNEATSVSSATDNRRASVPLPDHELIKPSLSFCVVTSERRCTEETPPAPSAGQQCARTERA